MDNLSFGQRVDPENGLVESWFVHGALDYIKSLDLTGNIIFQFGSGMGDAWLAKRCKKLYCVERNPEWFERSAAIVAQNGIDNVEYLLRPCNEGSGMDDYYTAIPEGVEPDVIINDDAYRTEVCQLAVDYFKKKGGGILICDNWIQSFVWMSPKAEEIMSPYAGKIFEQENHLDNDGVNKWKTGVWHL